MLGLTQNVSGDQARVGGTVGHHEDLGRAGEQVDPHTPEELALGLGDVGVAGPDEHVDRRQVVDKPEGQRRHRRQRLDPAERRDRVRPGRHMAYSMAGCRPPSRCGGATATTRGTPAALATIIVMNEEASIG